MPRRDAFWAWEQTPRRFLISGIAAPYVVALVCVFYGAEGRAFAATSVDWPLWLRISLTVIGATLAAAWTVVVTVGLIKRRLGQT